MIKHLIFRLRGALFSCTRHSNGIVKVRYADKFAISLYILLALVVYLKFLRGYNLFTVSNAELFRAAAESLEGLIPRVAELDCRVFMRANQTWSSRLDNLSLTEVAEEVVYKNSCDFTQSPLWQIPTTRMEESFPIAYSIMVYRDFDRFVRLLRAVYRENNVYCVHVDQNSDKNFIVRVNEFVGCLENVFTPPDSVHVEWAQPSVLEAELVCLRALWSHQVSWKVLINLTGQEFPLKTNLELVHIMQIMAGQNDVWIDPCTYEGPGDYQSWLCQYITEEGFKERWRKIEDPPFQIIPFKGQVHVVLFREAVDFILHSFVSKVFLEWVNKTFIPDELYFSSLNNNPAIGIPGGNKEPLALRPSIARFKLWWFRHRHIVESCDTYVRQICQLTPRELIAMTRSKQLFANKFKVDVKPLGYSCLEEWLYKRVLRELRTSRIQLDLTFYRRLFTKPQIV